MEQKDVNLVVHAKATEPYVKESEQMVKGPVFASGYSVPLWYPITKYLCYETATSKNFFYGADESVCAGAARVCGCGW